jgi:hypothetical protein
MEQISTRAKPIQKEQEAEQRPKESSHARLAEKNWSWKIRYPFAALLICVAVWVAQTDDLFVRRELFRYLMVAGLVINALALMHEVVLVACLGVFLVAIAYSIFGAIAAMPMSVAIVLGAWMIASRRS